VTEASESLGRGRILLLRRDVADLIATRTEFGSRFGALRPRAMGDATVQQRQRSSGLTRLGVPERVERVPEGSGIGLTRLGFPVRVPG
jgi:hypothetical protein